MAVSQIWIGRGFLGAPWGHQAGRLGRATCAGVGESIGHCAGGAAVAGATESEAWIGDPTEALYVETAPEHVLELARNLAEDGLMTVEGERASANAALMAQAEKFEADMRGALAELEKKHAFERG